MVIAISGCLDAYVDISELQGVTVFALLVNVRCS